MALDLPPVVFRRIIATPANDDFANRIFIMGSCVTVFGNNLGATREPGEPSTGFIDGSNYVWWAWTAPRSGSAVATWTGSSYSPLVAIFTGSALPSLTLGTNNSSGGGTSLRFPATQGVTYDISVDAIPGSGGDIVLNLAWRFDYVIPNHDGEDSENWDTFYFPIGEAGRTLEAFIAIIEGRGLAGAEKWEAELVNLN